VQVSQTNETAHILYTIISPSQQASFTVRQLIAKSHLTPTTCYHSKLYRPDHNGSTSSKQSFPVPHSPAHSAGANTTPHAPTGHYRELQRPDRGTAAHILYTVIPPSKNSTSGISSDQSSIKSSLLVQSAGLYQPTAARTTYTVYPFQRADAYLAPHASTSPVLCTITRHLANPATEPNLVNSSLTQDT
jgi:hypothetical protein